MRDHWDGEANDLFPFVKAIWDIGGMTEKTGAHALLPAVTGCIKRYTTSGLLDDRQAALVRFVVLKSLRVDVEPELERLRAVGYDDRKIHDIVMVEACFSFMNRLADGLGVKLEARKEPVAEQIFGERNVQRML